MREALLILSAWALAGAALAQPPQEGRYVSAAEARARVAEVGPDGSANSRIPTGPEALVLIVRRETPGEVEVHARLHDEFVVQDGHATVRVGGKVEGGRETAPGEWRGGAITGGRSYELGPGDLLWIPAGSPHQVTALKGGPFTYLALKFDAK